MSYENLGLIFPIKRKDRLSYFIDPFHLNDKGQLLCAKFYANKVLSRDLPERDWRNISVPSYSMPVTSLFVKPSGAMPKQTISLTAAINYGDKAVRFAFFAKPPGGDWAKLQDYGRSNKCNWSPDRSGKWKLSLWVKGEDSKEQFDYYKTLSYLVKSGSQGE